MDVEGYRPEKGKTDRDGNEVEDRIYNHKDFDRTLVIDERTQARGAKDLRLPQGKRRPLPEDHRLLRRSGARRAHAAGADQREQGSVRREPPLRHAHHRRATRRGRRSSDNFIDPEVEVSGHRHHLAAALDRRRRPDLPADRARPRRRLDDRVQADRRPRHPRPRGHEEVLLHAHRFPWRHQPLRRPGLRRRAGADLRARRRRPDHAAGRRAAGRGDDEPIPPEPGEDEVIVDGELPDITIKTGGETPSARSTSTASAATIVAERVEYLDENGKLVTESLRDFTKKALRKRFASLDDFLKRWKTAERKQAIIDELENEGLPLDPLAEEVGKDLDPFDLICHVAFDQPPLTRRERADNVRKRDVFTKYGPQARAVLEALLQKYQDEGVIDLDDPQRPSDPAVRRDGHARRTRSSIRHARGLSSAPSHELQSALYEEVA